MSNATRDYAVRLSLKGDGTVTAGMEKFGRTGQREFTKVERSANRASNTFSSMARILITRVAPVFAGGALVHGMRDAVSELAAIGDTAERLSLTAEELQKLGYIAEKYSVDQRLMNDGVQRFNRRIGLAIQGNKGYADSFKALGVDMEAFKDGQISLYEAILQSADGATLLNTKAEQMALLSSVFGDDAGPKIVDALNKGSDAMRELGDEAEKVGWVIENDLIKRAQDFDLVMRTVTKTMSTRFKSGLVGISVAIVDTVDKFRNDLAGAFEDTDENATALDKSLKAVQDRIIDLQAAASAAQTIDYLPGVEDIRVKAEEELRLLRAVQREAEAATMSAQEFNALLELGKSGGKAPNPFGGNKPDLPAPEGGTSSSKKDPQKRIREFIRDLKEQTQLLKVEGTEREKLRRILQAENAARAEGIELTPEQRREIELLSDEIERMEEAQRKAAEAAKKQTDEMDGLKKASEGVSDALQQNVTDFLNLGDAGNSAMQLVFALLQSQGVFSGVSGDGFFGSILNGIAGGLGLPKFARGGVTVGPSIAGEAGVPEAVVPLSGGRSIPVELIGGSGGISVTIINNTPASVGIEERARAGGGVDLVATIDDVQAKNIATPGSSTRSALMKMQSQIGPMRR